MIPTIDSTASPTNTNSEDIKEDVVKALSAINSAEPTPALDTDRPVAHAPINTRNLALTILATLAVIFALDWAEPFLVSLLLGILISYTLNPLVVSLERIKIPRVIGTTIVMVGALSGLVLGAYALRGQVHTIIEQLPKAANKVSTGLLSMGKTNFINMQKMQTAAAEIEKATNRAAGVAPAAKPADTHIVIDQPAFKIRDFLWQGSMGALGFMGRAAMVFFLVFFLLITGDTFKRKFVRITGPSLTKKKITVNILDDINDSIQRYMFMLLVTNGLIFLLNWLAFYWIGLENAGAWAAASGVLHIIPYFGPLLTIVATGMAAFMQFNSLSMALLVCGASLLIATVVGTIVTTWMTGKIAKMNAAAVFISLLFWAWLWGAWGLLLGIPIVVIIKVVSEHVDEMHALGELLGE
ncbi:MAG: AI-2E family transporter [Pseudomonadota bacterium]